MPAMKELQLCNRRPNVAGAARSYGVIIFLTDVTRCPVHYSQKNINT